MKFPSEYRILKLLSKQSEWLFAEDIARMLRTSETDLIPTINMIKHQGDIASASRYKTNTLSCPTYKITPQGIKHYQELRKKRFDTALALIGVVCTILSALAAFLF